MAEATDILKRLYRRVQDIAHAEITAVFGQAWRGGKMDGAYVTVAQPATGIPHLGAVYPDGTTIKITAPGEISAAPTSSWEAGTATVEVLAEHDSDEQPVVFPVPFAADTYAIVTTTSRSSDLVAGVVDGTETNVGFTAIMERRDLASGTPARQGQLNWHAAPVPTSPIPEITYPTEGATGITNPLTMTCTTITGATQYGWQIATDSAFTSPLFDDASSVTNIAVPNDGRLADGVRYYARVRTTLPTLSRWSTVVSFTMAAAAGQFNRSPADRVVIGVEPALAPNSGSWSIVMWVRSMASGATVGTTQYLWFQSTGDPLNSPVTAFGFESTGTLFGEIGDGQGFGRQEVTAFGLDSAGVAGDGFWHNMALTFDGAAKHALAYIDGQVGADHPSNTNISMMAVNSGDVVSPYTGGAFIGEGNSGGSLGQPFQGFIYDVRIYSVPLTATQVHDIWATGHCTADGSLIAQWPFLEGTGTAVADVIGARDGTFTGTTPYWGTR